MRKCEGGDSVLFFICFFCLLRGVATQTKEDNFMPISLNYRGEANSKEANATVQW